MHEIIRDNLFGLAKYVFISPLAGWMLTICLFEIFKHLWVKYNQGSKVKCWIYLSIFVATLGLLISFFLLGVFTMGTVAPLHSFEYVDGPGAILLILSKNGCLAISNPSMRIPQPGLEVVDFLVSFRASLLARGYQCPSLTEFCLHFREKLLE